MSENEEIAEDLVKGSTITFISLAVSGILAIIIRVFLARNLSPTDYGLLFSVIAFVSFFSTIRHLGIRQALTKFVSQYKAEERLDKIKSTLVTSLYIWLPTTLALAFIFMILSGWLSNSFFDSPVARPVLIILSVWTITRMTQNYLRSTFQAFRDMARRSGVRLIRQGFTLGLISLAVLIFGTGVIGVALSYLLGSIITSILFFFLLQRKHSQFLKGEGSFSPSLAKTLFSFGLPLLLSGTAGSVMGWTDTMILTAFRSLKSVGLYQIARPTTKFLGYFGLALGVPLFPIISELWAKNKKEYLRSSLSLISKFSVILITPAVLVLLSFPETVIRLLFGSEYLGAVTALRILSIGTVFLVGARILGPVMNGTGKTKLKLVATGTAALINILFNLLLIPKYGAGGAATATSISFFVMFILSLRFVRGIIKFPLSIIDTTKTLLGGGLALGILIFLKKILPFHPLVTFFIVLSLVSLFYLIWLLKTGTIKEKELEIIDNILPLPRKILNILEYFTSKEDS